MDTDSIVTNLTLPSELLGDQIGLFKLEHKIKEGYFITAKTYCIKTVDNVTIKKAKGVYSSSLNFNDYVDMYLNKQDVLADKNYSTIMYDKGSVNIDTRKTMLHHDAYTKREKVYNSKGKWIDTKPLVYSVDSNNNLYKVETKVFVKKKKRRDEKKSKDGYKN